jgi:hypothetical protein
MTTAWTVELRDHPSADPRSADATVWVDAMFEPSGDATVIDGAVLDAALADDWAIDSRADAAKVMDAALDLSHQDAADSTIDQAMPATDRDGDGVADALDDFPNDPSEWRDTDHSFRLGPDRPLLEPRLD